MTNFSHSESPDIWRQVADAIHEWSLGLRAQLASARMAAGFPQLDEYGNVPSGVERLAKVYEGCESNRGELQTKQAD
jgi:hypothetical protein